MARKRVTLADVAARSGLSLAAASMILNGRPDTRLSQDAHDRVHAAARELGYRPNVAARGLRTAKTHTIGFVSDTVATTRFASGLIRGALSAAEKAGHVVFVAETGGEPAREQEAIEALLDRQVDGFIFATMRARELFLPELPDGTEAVMLNATNPRHQRSVLPDESAGGRAAVELLVAAGHRHGIHLVGQSDEVERDVFRSATVARRVAGIRDAMAEHGLAFESEQSIWEWEPDNGYQAVAALLDGGARPRALLCMNDRIAFGAYQALGERGFRVPDDVSIASFDNDELAAYLRPGLTTIALPHEEMGRTAVELLLASGEAEGELLVPMPVISRASISAPADAS
ncbi:LacI family DNA-binding transcriptional regulator [Protaetiibacter intestinalis]|uniref:LacI family DNA-binding transcriptional regulator n=1 Tax=Protaetiibacter intestinalis TaxID=2419774 RepID=A0A387B0F1_9MICO|nr:LacI family DNA-binding transcriptional regulator [Protaetiibacter intestinalis]AYF96942.1 LacI family DNA-binding transcriptional regulator [Protaetiibacter intestinalis]